MLTIRKNSHFFKNVVKPNFLFLTEIYFWKGMFHKGCSISKRSNWHSSNTTIATCVQLLLLGILSSMEVTDCQFGVSSMFDYGLCTSPECSHFTSQWSTQVIWNAEFTGIVCF